MKERIAIFPGTFDPFTNGHHDIVMKAINLFDKIIIAFGENSQKERSMSLEYVMGQLSWVYENYPHVEIMQYSGLTTEFAEKQNANFIIRGLRNGMDLEYEKSISEINNDLNKEIETVFFLANPSNSNISSTVVRELHKYKKDISKYVPFQVTFNNKTKD